MNNNYYVLINYGKNTIKNFYLYDESQLKLYYGITPIGAQFERMEKKIFLNSACDFNILIYKKQFDDFLKLNFSEFNHLSLNQIMKKLELQEWLI